MSDRDPLQIDHRMPEFGCNPADLPVSSFTKGYFQQAVAPLAGDQAYRGRQSAGSIQFDALSPALKSLMTWNPSHHDPVGLLVFIAGVCEFQGEVAMVAQQQGSSAVCIQASHRVQTLS